MILAKFIFTARELVFLNVPNSIRITNIRVARYFFLFKAPLKEILDFISICKQIEFQLIFHPFKALPLGKFLFCTS